MHASSSTGHGSGLASQSNPAGFRWVSPGSAPHLQGPSTPNHVAITTAARMGANPAYGAVEKVMFVYSVSRTLAMLLNACQDGTGFRVSVYIVLA